MAHYLYKCKPRSISSFEALFDNFMEYYRTKAQACPTLDIDFQKEALVEHEEEEDPFLDHQVQITNEDSKGDLEWE